MLIHAQTTLFKTKNYWRAGPPLLMGVLNLNSIQFVVFGEVERLPYQEAELLIELHTKSVNGSQIYTGELEIVQPIKSNAANLAGTVVIGEKSFWCTTRITPEALKTKSVTLDFTETENDEKPPQPAPALKRQLAKPIRLRPVLR